MNGYDRVRDYVLSQLGDFIAQIRETLGDGRKSHGTQTGPTWPSAVAPTAQKQTFYRPYAPPGGRSRWLGQ